MNFFHLILIWTVAAGLPAGDRFGPSSSRRLSSDPQPVERRIGREELVAAKTGYVVDAQKGFAISGVTVIADWYIDSSGLPNVAPAGRWCILQKIVETDDRGHFEIPNVEQELDLSEAGSHVVASPFGISKQTHTPRYRIYVLKPGYIRSGDEQRIQQAVAGAQFDWAELPDVVQHKGMVELSSIRLEKKELDPQSLWIYDEDLMRDAYCSDRMAYPKNDDKWLLVSKQASDVARSLPCQLPGNQSIRPPSIRAFIHLLGDPNVSAKLTERMGVGVYEMSLTASDICSATEKAGL